MRIEDVANLWVKACLEQQWNIVEIILDKFPQIDINAALTEGMNKSLTPLWFAANDKKWEVVKKILCDFPQVDINAAPTEGKLKGQSFLWLLAASSKWDILLSILENPSVKNLDVLSLIKRPNDSKSSVLEYALDHADDSQKARLVTQLLVHYLFAGQPTDFEAAVTLLKQVQPHFLPQARVEIRFFIKKLIKNLKKYYHRGWTMFDVSPNLRFNQLSVADGLPQELRENIVKFIAPSTLAAHQARKLLELPPRKIPVEQAAEQTAEQVSKQEVEQAEQTVNKDFEKELTNLTRKALRRWEVRHLYLGIDRLFTKESKQDIGFCLRRCLRGELSKQNDIAKLIETRKTNSTSPIIPTDLSEVIIKKIGDLKLEELNESGFLAAIEDVLAPMSEINKKIRSLNLELLNMPELLAIQEATQEAIQVKLASFDEVASPRGKKRTAATSVDKSRGKVSEQSAKTPRVEDGEKVSTSSSTLFTGKRRSPEPESSEQLSNEGGCNLQQP